MRARVHASPFETSFAAPQSGLGAAAPPSSGRENATLPVLPSCATLLYFVDFCVTGSVVLLLCVAAGRGRKINQGWTLLD